MMSGAHIYHAIMDQWDEVIAEDPQKYVPVFVEFAGLVELVCVWPKINLWCADS